MQCLGNYLLHGHVYYSALKAVYWYFKLASKSLLDLEDQSSETLPSATIKAANEASCASVVKTTEGSPWYNNLHHYQAQVNKAILK